MTLCQWHSAVGTGSVFVLYEGMDDLHLCVEFAHD